MGSPCPRTSGGSQVGERCFKDTNVCFHVSCFLIAKKQLLAAFRCDRSDFTLVRWLEKGTDARLRVIRGHEEPKRISSVL